MIQRVNMKTLLLTLLVLCPAFALASNPNGKNANASQDAYEPTPSEMIEDFSQPWGAPLTELQPLMKRGKSYVFWLMVPPESPMDLRTPENFRRFIVGNTPFGGGISHNYVAWSCEGPGGRKLEGATAMSGESSGQSKKMILDGFGLTTFFSTFTDGYIDHTISVQDGLLDIGRKHGLATLGFEVSPNECGQMVSFLKKFARHPNKPYSRFGLTPDPEKMEGGGCVTFAMVLLKKAGIFPNVIPLLYRNLSAPRELLGGNMPLPTATEVPGLPWLGGRSHQISMNRMLSTAWIPQDYSVNLRVMDPELMLYAQKAIKDVYVGQFPARESAAEFRYFERTTLGPRATRSATGDGNSAGSARYIPIDNSFDPQMAKVQKATSDWALKQMRDGKTIQRGSILGHPVLLLQN